MVSGGVVRRRRRLRQRDEDVLTLKKLEAHGGMDAVGAGGDGLSPTFVGKKLSAPEAIIIFRL